MSASASRAAEDPATNAGSLGVCAEFKLNLKIGADL